MADCIASEIIATLEDIKASPAVEGVLGDMVDDLKETMASTSGKVDVVLLTKRPVPNGQAVAVAAEQVVEDIKEGCK